MNWVGRNGGAIPLNLEVDRADCSTGCVVTKGTFANAQFFLEYRPYIEDTEFWGANPGFVVADERDDEAGLQRQQDAQLVPSRIAERPRHHAGELRRHGELRERWRVAVDHDQRRPQQSGELQLARRAREHPGRAP